jgi:hypothetical protein
MTSVNISNLTNTVVVTDGVDGTVVSVITQGPQGPTGFTFDQAAKVDKSVIYYDAAASTFKADSIWTVPTLSDGGNF